MIVFSIDASGLTANICVMQDGKILFDKMLNEGRTHSETLLALADEAFRAVGISSKDVGLYVVTKGPGSFTGLRIGMALVKGLALPDDTQAVGVSTLQAIAVGSGLSGTVIPALNARRGEVYWAAYSGREGKYLQLVQDTAGPATEIADKVDVTQSEFFFVGDGAQICYNIYDYDLTQVNEKLLVPDFIAKGAAIVGLQMYENGKAGSAAKLRASYLRLSQAERERAKRIGEGK